MSAVKDIIKEKNRKFKGVHKNKKVSLKKFADMFFRSRFNRDPYADVADWEDENSSVRNRLFAKQDIEEILEMLLEFMKWFLLETDFDYIYLSKDMAIYRDVNYPRIKKANIFDVNICSDENVKEGDYYITHGRYEWMLLPAEELRDELYKKFESDHRRIEVINNLKPIVEERNKKND